MRGLLFLMAIPPNLGASGVVWVWLFCRNSISGAGILRHVLPGHLASFGPFSIPTDNWNRRIGGVRDRLGDFPDESEWRRVVGWRDFGGCIDILDGPAGQ